MNCWRKRWKWGGISRVAPFIFLVLLLGTLLIPVITATPAKADGGIAMSGSFYNQLFQIPQGASASGPSIYVVVFNQSTEEFTVAMSTVAPPEVTVGLSRSSFVLQPGSQQQVQVSVMVSMDAVPGSYVDGLEVSAQATKEDTGGVVILGAAAQRATLEVTGESALVMVDTVSPSGQPVATVVRLFKIINGEPYEFAYNNIGHLEATVSPGSYVASAYNNGDKLAEEAFEVAADEVKQVVLTVNTIFFSLFEINPAYNNETGELGFVQISYTLKNVYQQMATSTVRLIVTLDGESIEETDILNLSPLNLGDFGAPYNYSPASGWRNGIYGFSLRLYVNGQLYAGTQEQILQVGSASALPWWVFVLAALGGGLIIGGIIMFLKRRKKQDKPEKAQKARKHEKKESPAAGEEAGGIVYGLKRLLSRKGKATKKQAAPAKATAPATGAVVSAAAKKDAVPAAQAQQPHKEVPTVYTAKPAAERPAVTQAAAAQASVAPPPTTAPPMAATAQVSPAAKAEAAQPAVAQEAKPVQATSTAASNPAQSAAHVKSAADLKKAIVSRQAEGTTPALTATPGGTAPTAVATPRRDPLTVPSPFAAPREGPPTKKARFANRAAVARAGAAATAHMAAPATGTAPTQTPQETAPVRAAAPTVTPETIEPLTVPSPFAAPGEKPYAEKPAREVQVPIAEAPEAAVMPVEQAAPFLETATPEAEPVKEPSVEATVSMPVADLDAPPPLMQEDAGVRPAEDGADTGESGTPADGQPEGQAGASQDQDDEAAKKFVSPIRFLNR